MGRNDDQPASIAVVIPCFREGGSILQVLGRVPPEIRSIYVVDDACPDDTGTLVERECDDQRVRVLRHNQNLGVGGATISGYRAALADGADIIVKLDGDGQMDPTLIPTLVGPLVKEQADYTKGNRFYDLTSVRRMPRVRLIGNAVLSFLSKLSTGYWRIFDPNNGFTAIESSVLRLLPLDKLHNGYFFESDMLFRLNTVRAAVCDVPIPTVYGDEQSDLHVSKAIPMFAAGHTRNFAKRIFYNYFVRDFSIASVEWVLGPIMLAFGLSFGVIKWIEASDQGVAATAGTVMVAALTTIIGLQFILSALNFDIDKQPVLPIGPMLGERPRDAGADAAANGMAPNPDSEERWNVGYGSAPR
ncbi:MAG: glycosyltransferase family 2 protein [Alphaproteobacteria bacterium]|nr:glycosyltransferase family 2 protein [Alphaproteobacteria bacterium]